MKSLLVIMLFSVSSIGLAASEDSLGAHQFMSEGDCSGNRVAGDLVNTDNTSQDMVVKPKGEIR